MSARRVSAGGPRSGPARGVVASSAWADGALRHAFAGGLIMVFAALAAVRPVSGPGAGLAVGALVAGVLCALLVLVGGRVRREVLIAVVTPGVAVAVLGLAAFMSQNPGVSLLGMWGSRSAWAMWFVALAWLTASALASVSGGHAGRIARAVAWLGAVASMLALGQAIGLVSGGTGWSDKPSGVFENALSLAQFLLIGLGCAAAWYVSTSRPTARRTALILAGASAVGLVFAESRGAYLGAVVMGLSYLALRTSNRLVRRAVGALVASLPGVFAALLTAAVLASHHPVVGRIDAIMTGRLTLWRAAMEAFRRAPYLGRGPLQSSAYSTWGVDPSLVPMGQVAFDPHSIVMYWLVGAGLLGLALALWASWRLGRTLLASAVAPPAAWLVAGLAGWAASVLLTWVNPFALICVAALAGALLQPKPSTTAQGPPLRAVVAPVLAVSVPLALALTMGVASELRWTYALEQSPVSRIALATELWRKTGDPSYAVRRGIAYFELSGAGGDQDGGQLDTTLAIMREAESDAEWHASLAYVAIQVYADAVARGKATPEEFERAVSRANRADPATGFFDFVAMERLLALGYPDRARAYASRSLERPQTPETRAILEKVLAGEPVSVP